MKRTHLLMILVPFALVQSLHAQLFNAPKQLDKGSFYLGIEPGVFARDVVDPFIALHGGVGLNDKVDLALHAGFIEQPSLGVDAEWALAKGLTLVTGLHNYRYFGLNGAITYRVPLGSSAGFWFGADMDLDFGDPNVVVPIWIPVGVEVVFRKNMSFILESEIAVNAPASHIVSGGIVFYLN